MAVGSVGPFHNTSFLQYLILRHHLSHDDNLFLQPTRLGRLGLRKQPRGTTTNNSPPQQAWAKKVIAEVAVGSVGPFHNTSFLKYLILRYHLSHDDNLFLQPTRLGRLGLRKQPRGTTNKQFAPTTSLGEESYRRGGCRVCWAFSQHLFSQVPHFAIPPIARRQPLLAAHQAWAPGSPQAAARHNNKQFAHTISLGEESYRRGGCRVCWAFSQHLFSPVPHFAIPPIARRQPFLAAHQAWAPGSPQAAAKHNNKQLAHSISLGEENYRRGGCRVCWAFSQYLYSPVPHFAIPPIARRQPPLAATRIPHAHVCVPAAGFAAPSYGPP